MSPHALEAKGRGFGNRVKIGLFLTNQHRVGADLIQCQNEQLALFRQVRDSGWDSIFTGQHYLPEDPHHPAFESGSWPDFQSPLDP